MLENEFFQSQANKLLNHISSQCGILLQFEFGGGYRLLLLFVAEGMQTEGKEWKEDVNNEKKVFSYCQSEKMCYKQVSFHNIEKAELSHGTKFLYATEKY